MERFADAVATFEHAIERARQMITLYDALAALRPQEPANDDALRSSYFQTVSSFDFFAHELAALEAVYRFRNGIKTRNISLPMEIMTITDSQERINVAEERIRQINSFKAFVDPGKLSEMLSCFCDSPWEKLAERINRTKMPENQRKAGEIKGRLKSIWKRRNQIAHEADINPTLSGIGLWPIDKIDTELTIEFIVCLGREIPYVIADALGDICREHTDGSH